MKAKEKLTKLKNKLLEIKQEVSNHQKTLTQKSAEKKYEYTQTADLTNIKNILLDAKVDEYIDWYKETIVKGNYTEIGEYWVPIELRNFIEKMAVWYELRYPDYEINRLIPGSSQEKTKISDEMFNNNPYINSLLDENNEIRALDWDEFYNTHAFIRTLPWDERYRFQRIRYSDIVYLDPNFTLERPLILDTHLHLTRKGFVKDSEGVSIYSNYSVTDNELIGMHVKEVVKLLKEREVYLPSDNELEKTIEREDNWIKQKEGMLDAVMYRIIERGGIRMGPRRGFLFAKEFKRNIDIPMMYAIDRSDPGLRLFINEYLKSGGSKYLTCYIGYFTRTNKTKKLDTISIQELLTKQQNNAKYFYTEEETALHQRLVDILANHTDMSSTTTKKLILKR